MKIKVGSSYQSNINGSFLTEGVPLPEVWEIVVQLEPDLFIGRCVKPDKEILYREFHADGTNGYTRDAKVHRHLLPNKVKKESWGWKLRGTSSPCVYLCSDEATADSIVGGNPRLEKAESIWYEDEE